VIDAGRITNPIRLDRAEIAQEIARLGTSVVIQFSEPCYPAHLLATINDLCGEFRDNLEVRFFGHYGSFFDADVLRHISHVRSLSVDCLTSIANAEQIGRLPALSTLSFGVFEFADAHFLESLDLGTIERLTLMENRKRNFDLAPLVRASRLKRLYLGGHRTNIERIAELPSLEDLVLGSCSKTQSIAFLNDLEPLRKLEIILGGRPNIDDLVHPKLETLQIVRVQGLQSLGSLTRFPYLRQLRVEDQAKLASIDLTGVSLTRFAASNCKALTNLVALDQQRALEGLFFAQTRLDVDALLHHDWPQSLKSLGLFGKSAKWNTTARAKIEARGLKIYGGTW
jgi:hypothetical protein